MNSARYRKTFLLLTIVLVGAWVNSDCQAQETIPKSAEGRFESEILPILERRCFECHSHQHGESSGGLMLDSLFAMEEGGTRGPAVVPGDAKASLLVQAIRYTDDALQMPPEGKMPDDEIQSLERWISEGAQVPQKFLGSTSKDGDRTQEKVLAESHWAYQPPVEAEPDIKQAEAALVDSMVTPIDFFIGEQLAAEDLSMSPPAARAVLIRRLMFDLVGLPPNARQVQKFVNDPRPRELVIGELVDRLLSSPRFGERWARYWMDIARYADNKGYVFREDREYPEAYKYRDWLIQALNDDMPYDRFVTLQLAADLVREAEMAAAETGEQHLPALGFLTLGRRFLNNKFDIIDDRLDVVSRGLMGMTLACARCHDHKYDPISQADYYALAGVFLNTEEPGGEPWPHRLQDREKMRPSFILVRGNPRSRGEKVDRRFVAFLDRSQQPFERGSGRLEMASKIVSPSNPLTARVIANRVWMKLMGQSLVESPSDFGLRCPEPRQRKLIDHLALQLVANDWSLKSLVRSIVLSATYRQQSLNRNEAVKLDPENQLYWKANRKRLDLEAMRDAMLACTGQLNRQMFGESQEIHTLPLSHRRSVYAYIDRQNLPSLFRTFDFAGPDTHSPGRAETTVPQQGLYLLNSDFLAIISRRLSAQSAEATNDMLCPSAAADEHGGVTGGEDGCIKCDPHVRRRAAWLFEQILARSPSEEELDILVTFVNETPAVEQVNRERRWICGFGEISTISDSGVNNENEGRLLSFQEFPEFHDQRWQGGPKLPDPEIGWAFLGANGGHPGNDLQHAAVRRWIAPRAGKIRAFGKLRHPADQGDGVRGWILHQGRAVTSASTRNGSQSVDSGVIEVAAGDAVDFVVDCQASPSHDSFRWKVKVHYTDQPGERFDSVDEFPHPTPEPMDAWAQLAQALLASNEFNFID